MPPAGHALRAEVGGGIIFVTPGEFAGQHKKLPFGFIVDFVVFTALSCICQLWWDGPVSMAVMHVWVSGASWRNCRQKHGKTSFSPRKVFLFSRNLRKRFWGLVFWHLWIGRAKHPGPSPLHQLAVEVFNVGGWLTHGDLALDAGLDFLAVTEHRLIPARVRSGVGQAEKQGCCICLGACFSGFFSRW